MIMTRKYIAEYKQKEHFSFTSGGMTSDIVGNQSFSMTKDLMLARDSVVIIGGKKNIRFLVIIIGCFRIHLTKFGF